MIYLSLTQDCNLRCKYCYARGGESQEYMRFSVVKRILKRYERPRVQLTGGEPLLNFKLIRKIAENFNAELYLQTNATLLNEDLISEILDLGINISVSFDGPAKVNDLLRPYPDGQGSTKDVLKALMLLKSFGVEYGVTCVVTKINENFLCDFIDIAYAFGAKSVSFDVVKRVGRGVNFQIPDVSKINEAIEYSRRMGYKIRFQNELKSALNIRCNPSKNIFVSPSGEVYFTCPTLAALGIKSADKCPVRGDNVFDRYTYALRHQSSQGLSEENSQSNPF